MTYVCLQCAAVPACGSQVASIDMEGGARDEAGKVRRQKHCCARAIVDVTASIEGRDGLQIADARRRNQLR